ncbi:helix-turn-helix transcriptional regulator [Nocardioides sp. TF02-7]|uniref:helix-turn-helix domain-containing protein n=1 Tax=Nocardioides sp. TF02-7 TaxID=2917724 RepID=UPI0023DA0B9B|nr:helix-turn-helix transcriptional regulator [Nocardioides sp. TF02-7]
MSPSTAELLRSVDPADLGSRVRAARVAKGWTQTDLAGEEISVGYVSRIESGSRRPNLKVLSYLAGRLATPVEQLLRGVSTSEYDEIRLGLDYAELALESGEALDAERQAREHLTRAENASVPELLERGRYLLARSLEALGDLDGAIIELERLVETATGLTAIRGGIALCRCYRETGDLALAVEAGERIESKISDWGLGQTDEAVQLTATVAAAYMERGDLHRAARICSDAVRRAEDLSTARARAGAYWNASIVQAKKGDVQAALPLASRALALLSEGQDGRNLARMRVQLGELQLQFDPPEIAGAFENLARARDELAATSASEVDRAHNEVALAQAHLLAGDALLAIETSANAQAMAGDRAHQVHAAAIVVRGQALAALGRAEDAHASYRESRARADQRRC